MALLETALQAEKNLEKLATGLAEAGAAKEAVDTVSKMADVTRQIVQALGKGQEGTGDQEPPEDGATPAEQTAPAEPATVGEAADQVVDESQTPTQGAY